MCKTVRSFGVELEGYTNENLYGDSFYFKDSEGDSVSWDITDDGSLHSGDDCEYCREGTVRCDNCEGDGSYHCRECEGSGYNNIPCSCCDGSGTVMVPSDEEDSEEYEEDCEECNGNGYIDEECEYCYGSGTEECEDCNGSGETTCGECYGDWEATKFGTEVVSPILYDTETVHKVMDKLHGYDWEVDKTTGLHIHVGAEDYEEEDYRKLAVLMMGVEPVIYSMTSLYRYYGSSYALPMSRMNWEGGLKGFLDGHRGHRFASSRYFGLNFKSNHETVEFRYFGGEDDADRVENYIELVTKLVDFAKHGTMEQIKVIAKTLMECKTFFDCANKIKEILDLSFELWADNDMYSRYEYVRWEGLNGVSTVAEAV